MVRGRRVRRVDRVGGARRRRVAPPEALGVDRARAARGAGGPGRRLAAPGVGALRRVPQLAHDPHGVLALALPRAGALDGSRARPRPLARAGGRRGRPGPRGGAHRPSAAGGRTARAPPRHRRDGHRGRAGLSRRRLGQLVDAGRPVVERGRGAREVDALARGHHGGAPLAPCGALAGGAPDVARPSRAAAQRAAHRRRVGARRGDLQRAGDAVRCGAGRQRAAARSLRLHGRCGRSTRRRPCPSRR